MAREEDVLRQKIGRLFDEVAKEVNGAELGSSLVIEGVLVSCRDALNQINALRLELQHLEDIDQTVVNIRKSGF